MFTGFPNKSPLLTMAAYCCTRLYWGALEMVDHDLLLDKLRVYGVAGDLLCGKAPDSLQECLPLRQKGALTSPPPPLPSKKKAAWYERSIEKVLFSMLNGNQQFHLQVMF